MPGGPETSGALWHVGIKTRTDRFSFFLLYHLIAPSLSVFISLHLESTPPSFFSFICLPYTFPPPSFALSHPSVRSSISPDRPSAPQRNGVTIRVICLPYLPATPSLPLSFSSPYYPHSLILLHLSWTPSFKHLSLSCCRGPGPRRLGFASHHFLLLHNQTILPLSIYPTFPS